MIQWVRKHSCLWFTKKNNVFPLFYFFFLYIWDLSVMQLYMRYSPLAGYGFVMSYMIWARSSVLIRTSLVSEATLNQQPLFLQISKLRLERDQYFYWNLTSTFFICNFRGPDSTLFWCLWFFNQLPLNNVCDTLKLFQVQFIL